MIGLSGTRVIVLDDEETDAVPILKALAKKGIPTAFFDGSIDGLPALQDRLKGVRLAILDMDLIGGGASLKAKAATLVTRLERILSSENGPYIALIWTNQPELQVEFEDYCYQNPNVPNPILSLLITKAECKTLSGRFSLPKIRQRLEQAFLEASPLTVLQSWEGECFKAATEVTVALSKLATTDAPDLQTWRNNWRHQLLTLMHAMAAAELAANLDADCCTDGLFSSLNPLHADAMESYATRLSSRLKNDSAKILNSPRTTSTEQKGKLNTMLHLAFENLERYSPGNIYVFRQKRLPPWIASNKELVSDMASGDSNEISKQSRRVLIESSAVCDHAQGNLRHHRFITGLIVPAEKRKRMKRGAAFIFELGPLYLGRPVAPNKGDYYLYFSARHEVTRSRSELRQLTAVTRLRAQALTDLQAWYSRQSARPGMVMLKE
jgi:hypothetical protein